MGRGKMYTPKTLDKAVSDYFSSISRTVDLTETVETGEYTSKGKPIRKKVMILNDKGEPIRVREFVHPPTVGGLCAYLGISMTTWENYCNNELYIGTTARARDTFKTWLTEQLLTRNSTRGIEFQLSANYGAKARQEIELGPAAAAAIGRQATLAEKQAMLAEIMAEVNGQD